ncbi:MAG TPA: hypothetical protein DDY82_03860 [Clostridiales bacterium]|nr:hypothetical protein [Clostridiales bacterium]
MASLVLKVYQIFKTEKFKNTKFVNSIFDCLQLIINDNKELIEQFKTYMAENKDDIESHINLLLKTVKDFTNKKD